MVRKPLQYFIPIKFYYELIILYFYFMGRRSIISIKESLKDLKEKYKKEPNQKLKLRLKCLIYTKESKFKTQTILATHLGIDYSSLKRWFKQYKEEGLDSYLSIKSGGNKPSIITAEIHEHLEMEYNTVRTYLIRHFKTKIKQPRKSHYKKDEQAIEAFFKTSK